MALSYEGIKVICPEIIRQIILPLSGGYRIHNNRVTKTSSALIDIFFVNFKYLDRLWFDLSTNRRLCSMFEI